MQCGSLFGDLCFEPDHVIEDPAGRIVVRPRNRLAAGPPAKLKSFSCESSRCGTR